MQRNSADKVKLIRQLTTPLTGSSHSAIISSQSLINVYLCSDFVLGHFIVRAREAELKRMDKDKELPVVVRLFCGGLAGGISQTGKSGFPLASYWLVKLICHSVKWNPFFFSNWYM